VEEEEDDEVEEDEEGEEEQEEVEVTSIYVKRRGLNKRWLTWQACTRPHPKG